MCISVVPLVIGYDGCVQVVGQVLYLPGAARDTMVQKC